MRLDPLTAESPKTGEAGRAKCPDPLRIHAATTSALLPACPSGTDTSMQPLFSALSDSTKR